MFEIFGISLKLGLVDLHLGFLLGVDDGGRLGHVTVMFMLFNLVMFMFFFPPVGLMFMFFGVHVLLFWVCSLIMGLMSLLGLIFMFFDSMVVIWGFFFPVGFFVFVCQENL